jgi:hypothetical protein
MLKKVKLTSLIKYQQSNFLSLPVNKKVQTQGSLISLFYSDFYHSILYFLFINCKIATDMWKFGGNIKEGATKHLTIN